jgi:hypothetical protein
MTNTYAPQLLKKSTPSQIVSSIYYWIDENTWAPGIAFPAGPNDPTEDLHDKDFFYNTTVGHLKQYQTDHWEDLGTAANAITSCGTTVPSSGSGNNFDLFNKYDSGEIYQKIDGVWRNVGSNKNGLPLSADAINFTDSDKIWRSVNLGLIMARDDGDAPLLATDQGLIVKKDIGAGGFLSSNQGVLMLGSGFINADDVPKIMLIHTGVYGTQDTLYLKQFDDTSAHLDLGDLTVHGDLSIEGYIQFNSDAKFVWVNTSTLAVQDEDGVTANGALDVGSVYINNLQPLNSGSPAGININCPLSIGGSRGTSGQVLTSNGSSSSPTWQNIPVWNGGIVTNNITINRNAGILKFTGNYPYVEWLDSQWGASAYLQSGVTSIGGAGGNYMLFQLPSGKSFGVNTGGSLVLSVDGSGNLSLGGSLYGIGGTLGIANDTSISHSGITYFNVNSTNSSSVINLQQGSSTKIDIGYDGSTGYINSRTSKLILTGVGDGNSDAFWFYGGHVSIRGGYHIIPESYEGGYCGNSSHRWYGGYIRTVYTLGGGQYDLYDDLAIAKLWGEVNPEWPDDYDPTKIKPAGRPFDFLKPKKENGEVDEYFNLNYLTGFAMSCIKTLAKRNDEYDAQFEAVLSDIEDLRSQIQQLKETSN